VRLFAAALVCTLGLLPGLRIQAAAAQTEQPLTASISASKGTVLSSADLAAAEDALDLQLAKQQLQDAKEQLQDTKQQLSQLVQLYLSKLATQPLSSRFVAKNSALTASSTIQNYATDLGSFKLTFYCPCAICCGVGGGTQTYSGTRPLEGRTIAVDPSVIPLGSRVYIDGYGMFIAEDTGGAVKGNHVDIFLNSHARCEQNGVTSAKIYLIKS
jgi:3D (Asp-Asp-Asp) domain-containing protein